MSIEHANYRTIRHSGLHVVSFASEVHRAIGHADAIAIWTHLLTMAANWQIKKKAIMDALDIGADRYKNGMKYLKRIGLVIDEDERNEKGQIQKRWTTVVGIPRNMDQFIDRCNVLRPDRRNKPTRIGQTKPEKPTMTENRDPGETDLSTGQKPTITISPHRGDPQHEESPHRGDPHPLSSDQKKRSSQSVSK